MVVFRVPVKVGNWQNRYLPAERRGEEVQCEELVDSGAAELALPIELRVPPAPEPGPYTDESQY